MDRKWSSCNVDSMQVGRWAQAQEHGGAGPRMKPSLGRVSLESGWDSVGSNWALSEVWLGHLWRGVYPQ
jgi:hypothetical protein